MVEIDKILSERSDERVLKALKEISDSEFTKLVESILGYLELKVTRSRPKGSFVISECIHRPDGKRYVVFFSRRSEVITKADVDSLLSYMSRVDSPNGLVLTASSIDREGTSIAERNNVDLADGVKLAALLRRFDLDRDVVKAADLWKERAKITVVPGADRQLEEAMKLGYEAIASRDFMKALDFFDRAIMLREDYDVPWRLKGNTLDEMGYHEQALECYKHALELYPESDETWFSLGSCLFSLGRYAEEIICYDRALQYNPVMQKALVNKGSTLHRLGRYKEALEAYDKVLKINYRLEKVHNNRGATLHAMGQLNDALASYSRAIELKHDYVEAWMNKGSLLYEMGRYTEAFESFTQMTHIRPELPKGWYLRGLAARKTGNVSAAKASFEGALRLDHDYADAKRALEDVSKKIQEKYVEVPRIVQDIFSSDAARPGEVAPEVPLKELSEDMLARVQEESVEELAEEIYGDRAELLLLLGKPDEAFDLLGKSLKLEGENAPLLTAAGNVLFGLGKSEAATKSYEHAAEIDPSYAPALINLQAILAVEGEDERAAKASESLRKPSLGWQGRIASSLDAFTRKDYVQALEDVDVALALEDLAAVENFKGLARLESGDLDGALQVFLKAKGMLLDESEAINNDGIVMLKKGELEKASNEFDSSIKARRNNHAAWNNRGCVLYRLERLREAIACFDESSVMLPSAVALTNKGFSQLSLDLLPDALRSFDASLRLSETPEAYNNKGIVLERMGKHDDALVSFKEALRVAPQFKDALENIQRMGRMGEVPKPPPEPERPPPPPPGEEVLGDRETATSILDQISEPILQEKKKSELEAICESLGLNSRGTRSDLVVRILKAKQQRTSK